MIKELTLAVAIATMPVVANADSACDTVDEVAAYVMKKRQEGMRMSALINATQGGQTAMDKLYRQLVSSAYERPLFSTQRYKRRSIKKFRNYAYRICYKGQ